MTTKPEPTPETVLTAAARYVEQLAPHVKERQGTVLLITLITENRNLSDRLAAANRRVAELELDNGRLRLVIQQKKDNIRNAESRIAELEGGKDGNV